jgi:hypothetical protein
MTTGHAEPAAGQSKSKRYSTARTAAEDQDVKVAAGHFQDAEALRS